MTICVFSTSKTEEKGQIRRKKNIYIPVTINTSLYYLPTPATIAMQASYASLYTVQCKVVVLVPSLQTRKEAMQQRNSESVMHGVVSCDT